MSYTRKIKAGLVHENPSLFVGQRGTIFYNNDTGAMFISDGVTPGGTPIAGGGVDLSRVTQHIIPASDNTYDLGSSTHQWRHMYVSSNTIYINNVPLTIDPNTQLLKINNTVYTGAQGPQGVQGVKGDAGLTGAQGDAGPRGLTGGQGVSVTLKGTKATIADLPVSGSAGDAWIVTTGDGLTHLDGSLWFWNSTDSAWNDVGRIVGPQGDIGATGPRGLQGLQGNDGAQGPRGLQGLQGPSGPGVASGGTTNQILVKLSNTDYDTTWIDHKTTGDLSFITNAMYNLGGIIIENADLTHGATAAITMPANGGTGSVYVNNTYGDVQLTAGINGVTTSLQFTGTGLINLPSVGGINQNNTWTKSVNSPLVSAGPGVVIWTSTQNYISSAKLTIQVECSETGNTTGWQSQACEAIIACRGASNIGPTGDPQIVVYGVVHTSLAELVTFSAQRNLTTKMIEVVATLTTAASGTAYIKVHSVELGTRD